MTSPKIAIIDDQSEVRDGLRALLSYDFEIICFESARAFLDELHAHRPACLLLDLRMPDIDGLDLQSALVKANYDVPIIFMSGDANQSDVISAWRAGASDFILKPFTGDQIISRIESVLKQSTAESAASDNAEPRLPITKREAQILLFLGRGLQQHQIAERLGLSLRTVKMYRANLKDKLGLNSLAEIGVFCDRHRARISQIADIPHDNDPLRALSKNKIT